MKKVLQIMLVFSLVSQALQALDLHDAACSQLKTAIDQVSVEAVKTAWTELLTHEKVSVADQRLLQSQIIAYVIEQKEKLERHVSDLGNADHDPVKLRWGIGKTSVGAWSILGLGVMAFKSWWDGTLLYVNELITQTFFFDIVALYYIFDEDMENPYLKKIACLLLLARLFGGSYLLYSGISNIRQAWNYKNQLQNRIASFEEIISYFPKTNDELTFNSSME